MRPIRRNASPQPTDFADYRDALPYLVSRLGPYCSYCERRIATSLAVEHVQPKSVHTTLEGRWENFLLACVNCNSTKKDKDLPLADHLLPDRDNTAAAFSYTAIGGIAPSPATRAAGVVPQAQATLALVGLDKPISVYTDERGKQIALDRVAQRIEAWQTAEDACSDWSSAPSLELQRSTCRLAQSNGFFSVWMAVFAADPAMKNALIDAFPGTRASGCFDANGDPISPAPNPDGLSNGGKI